MRVLALLVGVASAFAPGVAAAEPLLLGKIHTRRFRRPVHHHHNGHASGTTSAAAAAVPEEDRWDFSTKIDGGYEVGRLDGDGTGGTRWGLGFGLQNDAVGCWGTLRGRIVPASVGVRAWDVRLGIDADVYRSGAFHVGAGAEVGGMEHARPSAAPRQSLTFGMGARAGVDLVSFGSRDRSALTLDLRADMHLLAGGGSYATLGVLAGVRF